MAYTTKYGNFFTRISRVRTLARNSDQGPSSEKGLVFLSGWTCGERNLWGAPTLSFPDPRQHASRPATTAQQGEATCSSSQSRQKLLLSHLQPFSPSWASLGRRTTTSRLIVQTICDDVNNPRIRRHEISTKQLPTQLRQQPCRTIPTIKGHRLSLATATVNQ
jgi:hypothetical protein